MYKPQRHKTYIILCILDWRQAHWSQIDSRIIVYRVYRITNNGTRCACVCVCQNNTISWAVQILCNWRKWDTRLFSETFGNKCPLVYRCWCLSDNEQRTTDNGQRRHAASDCVRQRTYLTAYPGTRPGHEGWGLTATVSRNCRKIFASALTADAG